MTIHGHYDNTIFSSRSIMKQFINLIDKLFKMSLHLEVLVHLVRSRQPIGLSLTLHLDANYSRL